MFGGRAGIGCPGVNKGGLLNDTWLWDGSVWHACVTCTTGHMPPAARESQGMAPDEVTGNLVMFGGSKQMALAPSNWTEYATPIVGDGNTFIFHGTPGANDGYWANPATTGPCARVSPTLVWDGASSRQRVLLFGGNCGGTLQSDTWTWDATHSKWVKCNAASCPMPPDARDLRRMSWDPTLGEAALFGGESNGDLTYCTGVGAIPLCQDTFTVNGTWTQCLVATCTQTPNVPQPRCCVGIAYDPGSSLVIMFGGQINLVGGGRSQLDDTWTFDGTTWSCILGTCPP